MTKESVHKWKRFLSRSMGSIGVILIVLLALYFLFPKLIGLESIRAKIKARISQEIAGTMDFQKMDVSLFPQPRIVIDHAKFAFPGTAEGTIDSLIIYPRLFPLLAGKVTIARIQLEAPHVSLTVPARGIHSKIPFSASDIEEKLSLVLNTLASNAPDIAIAIEKGSIKITDPNRLLFSFQDLDGQIVLPPGRVSITLICSSNISKSISLGIRLDPKDFTCIGTLKLTGLKPQLIIPYFFPDALGHLGDSEGNLMLSFRMLGFKDLQAAVQGSFKDLTFLNKNERILLKGVGINGALALTNDKNEITLNELKLEYPRLTLSGALMFDKALQDFGLELTGSQVDVSSLRNVALSLAGKVPIVQDIFGYVRGGNASFITLRSHGASLKDLGKTESILVKGLMKGGEIFVPGPHLDFKEVNGDCIISKGILEGKHVEGNLGNSQVRDGKLRVGLTGRDAPLHIDAAVRADLAEARNILRRLIKDEPFLKEIDRIHAIHGEARGRIILGDSTTSVKPRLDLSEVSFTAEYQRLPFPLVIKEGQFIYDERQISVKKLGGTLGMSSFAELTGELRLGDTPYIVIPSGKVRIDQDEVYPWLKSFDAMKGSLEDIRSVRGVITLDTLHLEGPLQKPKEWHFMLSGKVEDIVLDGAFLPAAAFLKKGTVAASEERISLTDAHADILDASVVLSGAYQGYLRGSRKTDMTFQGKMGPRSLQWTAKLADLPPQISLQHPITVEHAHIALEEGAVRFQGKLRVQRGLEIGADLLKHSKGLVINKLTIHDASSDAVLSIDLQDKTLKLAFAGNLNSETVNRIITEKEFPEGSIAGDFRTEIQREKPFRFTAQGKLRGENISLSLKQGVLLTIKNLSMDGDGNRLAVDSASLAVDNNPFSLQGSLKSTPEDLVVDMDLSTDRIEWGKIAKTLEAMGKTENSNTWDLPVNGTLRLKANAFTYDKYSWMPLRADIAVHRNDVAIVVTRATLCGISSPGTLSVTPGGLSLDFQLTADNQELESTLECLVADREIITGMFDLKGTVKAQGAKETLLNSLQGTVEFVAKDGRIYRDLSLLKVFDFLEINQILRGFSQMRQKGLEYQSIKAKGELKAGLLKVKEGIMDSSVMKIAAEGSADLKNEKVDFTVLICPLRKTDYMIKMIPIVGRILGGTLISIPLDISGDLKDPKVSYQPVSAVGSGLLGIIKRTIETPVKLFDPFLPGEKK
ncbi:MAG: AsmA-like C-terminal domain-containing protein [Thermodesulfovibrionales bacterium]|jgi:hypothetical protein